MPVESIACRFPIPCLGFITFNLQLVFLDPLGGCFGKRPAKFYVAWDHVIGHPLFTKTEQICWCQVFSVSQHDHQLNVVFTEFGGDGDCRRLQHTRMLVGDLFDLESWNILSSSAYCFFLSANKI